MDKTIFNYLKRKFPTDPHFVNKLFVTVFVRCNHWRIKHCDILLKYLIDENDAANNTYVVDFLAILQKTGCNFTLEELINLFEFVISPSDRVVTGAVYTPQPIRKYIINNCLNKVENLAEVRVADIACGCGSFLMDVAKELHKLTGKSYSSIYSDNIFGVDIQEYSIERTCILLSLLALSQGEDENFLFNLFAADTITFDFKNFAKNDLWRGFDIIVGNPPYVCSRNMAVEVKESLTRWSVCGSGHPDLYIPFFQIALEQLKEGGVLGYITMNTFFKSVNGRNLRQYLQKMRRYFSIIDFRGIQIFKYRNTYTCICILQNVQADVIEYAVAYDGSLSNLSGFNIVNYDDLDAHRGWNLNFHTSAKLLESVGTPLGKFCKSRHGIATLSNRTYIFTPYREDSKYYYFMRDGKEWKVERDICRDIVNSNRMTKDISIETVIEKAIYPYTNEQHPSVLKEDYLKTVFPCAYHYLLMQKKVLMQRDKGKGNYAAWYAYGRTQSLEPMPFKLFFPKLAENPPRCVLSTNANLLFYNGQAFISDNILDLRIVQKIVESDFFWTYIAATSKPYSSNYYSLNGNYVKNFGVCSFSKKEIDYLITESDRRKINIFLIKKYAGELKRIEK